MHRLYRTTPSDPQLSFGPQPSFHPENPSFLAQQDWLCNLWTKQEGGILTTASAGAEACQLHYPQHSERKRATRAEKENHRAIGQTR
jgi:hypothetical protein